MKNNNLFVFDTLILLAAVIDSGLLLGSKKDLDQTSSNSSIPSSQNSHEELHSKNDSSHLLHESAKDGYKQIKSSDISSQNGHLISTNLPPKTILADNITFVSVTPPRHEIVAEGGLTVSTTRGSSPTNLKNNTNEVDKQATTAIKLLLKPPSVAEANETSSEQKHVINDKPVHKRIHGRPGVPDFDSPMVLNSSSSTTTQYPSTKKKKNKPLFTMITGDKETKESESFIESPTTGRDYVLPIVLTIMSLPILAYIIKIIYKRGTEFTERQQYHRMYLIDGMYNSREDEHI